MSGRPALRPPATELDEAALVRYGRRLGERALEENAFVCLYGDLGTGKSTLVRAACAGAGVSGLVPSPTFTLVNVYAGRGGRPIHHADLHRLAGPDDLPGIGWPDLLEAEGPVFVEWAERAAGWLPARRWEVRLGFTAEPERRTVRARSVGGAARIPAPEEAGC